MQQTILKYILALFSSLIPLSFWGQTTTPPKQQPQRTRGVQYVQTDSLRLWKEQNIRTFQGFQISFDAAGLVMYGVASYGQIEGALRVNIKERFFPILEVGLGHSNHSNEDTELHYKTDSPYFRIGCDYNFNKDITSGNRVYGGFRIAYTKMKYDVDGPDVIDPVWHTSVPYHFTGLNSNCTWGELVFGLEANIWKNFHLGWSARYRLRLKQNNNDIGAPWYIAGYGSNEGHTFGATFNIIFDI